MAIRIDVNRTAGNQLVLSVSSALVNSFVAALKQNELEMAVLKNDETNCPYLERLKVEQSRFVVFFHTTWKTSVIASPFQFVDQQRAGGCTQNLSWLTGREPLNKKRWLILTI